MSSDRAKRIKMLQRYTLGEYRLYFVKLGDYRAKIFLKKKPTENPLWSFTAPTMEELVKRIDDLSLGQYGKVFRYRIEEEVGLKHPALLKDMNESLVDPSHYKPRHNVKKKVSKELDCMSEKVKIWSELYESLKQQRILAVLGIMFSALAVALLLWK